MPTIKAIDGTQTQKDKGTGQVAVSSQENKGIVQTGQVAFGDGRCKANGSL